MQDLPYEIWLLIVAHLPAKQVRQLYSVNKALFDIAMDLRYEEACLGANSRCLKGKDICRFRSPVVASRPRCLRIQLSSLTETLRKAKQRESESVLKRIGALIANHTMRNGLHPVEALLQTALDVMPGLIGIMELDVVYENSARPCYGPLTSMMFTHVWQIYGKQLRSLHILCPFEMIAALLPASLSFPCLETLSIDCFSFYRTTYVDKIGPQILIPFLSAHRTSLRNIALKLHEPTFDMLPILRCMGKMACLHSIGITAAIESVAESHLLIQLMLMAQQQHLQSLHLHFYPVHYRYVRPFGPGQLAELPHLRELSISGYRICFIRDVLDYLHNSLSSVVSLTSQLLLFRYEEIQQLTPVFQTLKSLRNLNIGIRSFNPATLALLAHSFPRLQSLKLRYSFVSSGEDDIRHCDVHLFSETMENSQVFCDWALVALDYSPKWLSFNGEIEWLLVLHLPNVQTFCQTSREEFLQSLGERRHQAQKMAMPGPFLTSQMSKDSAELADRDVAADENYRNPMSVLNRIGHRKLTRYREVSAALSILPQQTRSTENICKPTHDVSSYRAPVN